MKITTSLIAMCVAVPALAADPGPFGALPQTVQNVFADAPLAPPRTGLVPYVGLNGGISFADTELSVPGASFDGIGSKGGTFGLNAGVDYITASKLFAGLYASYNFQNTATELKIGPDKAKIEMGDSWALGGRVGLDYGRARIYALAGYRHTDLDWPTGVQGVPKDLAGLDLGLGTGVMLAKNVEFDVKAVWTQYQDEKINGGPLKIETQQLQGLASINFRF